MHTFFRERYERVARQIADAIIVEQDAGLIPCRVDAAHEAQRLIAVSYGVQLQALLAARLDAVALLAGVVESLRTLADDPSVRLSDHAVPLLVSLRREIASA